jgi:hypothetical protein
LGARFGDQAADVLKAHYTTIAVTLLVAAALVLLIKRYMFRGEADPA